MNVEKKDVSMTDDQNEISQKDDEDESHKKRLELQEQSLGPLKEDLAEWIAKTLGNRGNQRHLFCFIANT